MKLNLSQCRLCLTQSSNLLNIFSDKIDDKTISTVLAQHFWFEVKEDDLAKHICQDCSIKVEDFHLFYTRIYNIHIEIFSKVNPDIKLEIDDNPNTAKIEFVNNLKEDSEVKIEPLTNITINQVIEDQDTLLSGLDDDDKLSDCSFKATNNINDSDSESISDVQSPPPLPPPPPPKKRLLKRNSNGKKRKTKTAKTNQPKKEIDPEEQAKIKQQNKQISEYFSMDCELCTQKLDSFRNLQFHYRMEHKIKGYVRCCSRKYVKRVYILEHMGHHLNPQTFSCEICNKNFAAKRCLQLHLRSHIPTEERPYKCTECPKTYVIANLLKRHLETHGTDRKFECGECGKLYVTEFQLKSHQRSMHNEANIHICDVCAKPFRSKDVFEKHHKSVHGKEPFPKVQCKICGSWVKHKYYLKQHMTRHTDSNTSFPCTICGKSAPNVRALQSHMRVVHTEKMYECKLCEKTFKRSISLKEHMASHTGDILYSCPYCPKTFNSSANMYTHRKRSHVKEWEEQKLEKLKGSAVT